MEEIKEKYLQFYHTEMDYTKVLKEKYHKYKNICIFGAGNLGRAMAAEFEANNIRVDFFCDNDEKKWGEKIENLICISPLELEKIKEETIVIICTRYYKEIKKELEGKRIPNIDRVYTNKFMIWKWLRENPVENVLDNIRKVMDICCDNGSKDILKRILLEWINCDSGNLDSVCTYDQYFCPDIIRLAEKEVFIDGGAYTGDTLEEFLKFSNSRFERAILYELSEKNFKNLKSYVEKLETEVRKKIVCRNAGISDKNEVIYYSERDEGTNEKIKGDTEGRIIRLDDEWDNENITYIKMDVEGSEMAALRGAEKIIKAKKPKLAICLYHKPADLWEIPLYIKSLVPEYKIYIRHHTDLLNETVCYAMVD